MDHGIRPAAVADMFYPGSAAALSSSLTRLLNAAPAPPEITGVNPAGTTASSMVPARPKALIVPHAGYLYSGPTAAAAYRSLLPFSAEIRRVILLGPCHRVAVRGMAVPSVSAFATPLGNVFLDRVAIDQLTRLPSVCIDDNAHAQEHSLEVQLPFLQAVLREFQLVPIAVGAAAPTMVADVLEAVWGGPDTLILISSDLSHFLSYEEACRRDQATLADILRLKPLHDHEQACGATPINGLLLAASRHGLRPQRLDLRNSGDTAGDKIRVVGYTSVAFMENTHA